MSIQTIDRALYFPFINVPQGAWFSRVLLYWDEIGSIVPFEHAYAPNLLKPYTQELIRSGLLKPISPGQYISQLPRFSAAFLEYIDQARELRPVRQANTRPNARIPVHIQKLGDIADELCKRGLACQVDYSWYDVEQRTAEDFMAYLAAVLGQLPEVSAVPITDRLNALASLSTHPFNSAQRTQARIRGTILERILPAPAGAVRPEKLARFKDDHREQLIRFRSRVESLVSRFAAMRNPVDLPVLLQAEVERMGNEVEDIAQLMRNNGWRRIVLGSLCPVLGAGLALGNAWERHSWVTGVAASLTLVPAVYSALQVVHTSSRVLPRKPLAYAALARREFGYIRS